LKIETNVLRVIGTTRILGREYYISYYDQRYYISPHTLSIIDNMARDSMIIINMDPIWVVKGDQYIDNIGDGDVLMKIIHDDYVIRSVQES